MKKIVVALGILVMIEVLLQLVSFALVSRRQSLAVENIPKDHVRIVALGESTTDNAWAEGRKAWPELLQEKLNQRGVKASVINRGKAGATSSQILAELDDILATYEPRIVVAMVGINDTDLWIAEMQDSFLGRVKSYRIVSWVAHAVGDRLRRAFASDRFIADASPELMKSVNLNDETLIEKLPPREQARVYAHLAKRLLITGDFRGLGTRIESLRLFRKSLETGYLVSGATSDHALLLGEANLKAECLALLKRHIAIAGAILDHMTLMAAESCADDSDEWREILDTNRQALQFQARSETTKSPVIRIYEKILASGSALIVMQYPMREKNEVMNEMVEALAGRKAIVENRENFKAALKTRSRSDVFIDDFAGGFGHTTRLGHELLAEAALPAALEMIKGL